MEKVMYTKYELEEKMLLHKENKLVPFKEYYCDKCGEVIENSESAYLQWKNKGGRHPDDEKFTIVHHPSKDNKKNCQYKGHGDVSDGLLKDYEFGAGLPRLLQFIDDDTAIDNKEVTEIIARLNIPYYEEARRYHSENMHEETGVDLNIPSEKYSVYNSIILISKYSNS